MKVAPLIYSRTYYCDFNAQFLVCPNDFSGSDIVEIKKYVSDAMRNVDDLVGCRYVVFSKGNIRVFGIVSRIRELLSELVSTVEHRQIENLCVDEKGRGNFAFVGFVCHNDEMKFPIEVENKLYAKLYYDNVRTIWNNKYLPHIVKGYENLELEKMRFQDNGEIRQSLCKGKVFEQSEVGDKKLFDYFCQNCMDFSFCSNKSFYADIKDTCFDIVTTSHNVIVRMENEKKEQSNKSVVKWKEIDINEIIEDVKKRYGEDNYRKIEDSILEPYRRLKPGTKIYFEGKEYKISENPHKHSCELKNCFRHFRKNNSIDNVIITIEIEKV